MGNGWTDSYPFINAEYACPDEITHFGLTCQIVMGCKMLAPLDRKCVDYSTQGRFLYYSFLGDLQSLSFTIDVVDYSDVQK